jgi:hypothetical protein
VRRSALVIGWREWVRLPDLEIRLIKAKIDTGAQTSALHAEDIDIFRRGGRDHVAFTVHPRQRTRTGAVSGTAPLVELRHVRSSSGHLELRPVILTRVDLGGMIWPIEMTLTRRDVMGFRMLLGRGALRGHAIVDPGHSFLSRKVRVKPKTRTAP